MKPVPPNKDKLEKRKELKLKQLRIIDRFINDDKAFNHLRALIEAGEISTDPVYKAVGKFDNKISDPLENYQLVIDLATAARRLIRTTE